MYKMFLLPVALAFLRCTKRAKPSFRNKPRAPSKECKMKASLSHKIAIFFFQVTIGILDMAYGMILCSSCLSFHGCVLFLML